MNYLKVKNRTFLIFVHLDVNILLIIIGKIDYENLMLEVTKALLLVTPCIAKHIVFIISVLD